MTDSKRFDPLVPDADRPVPAVADGARRRRPADAPVDRAGLPAGFREPIALDAATTRAVVEAGAARLAFTTDSYVVQPLFFPGGDIGTLAVNGTVNDLAMCGARPLCAQRRVHPRGGPRHRDARARRGVHASGRARSRRCRSSPATPRSWTAARATASSSTPPASAWSSTTCASCPPAFGPETPSC